MNLDRVTLTGADDSTKPEALLNLSEEFGFVEWGILFSKSHQGEPRYPSEDWIQKFREKMDKAIDAGKPRLNLSAHLCGRWVRDLVLDGKFTFYDESPHGCWPYFQRIQLNFHGHKTPPCSTFLNALKPHDRREFIFQLDGVNDVVWKGARDKGISAVPLFDRSGGAGVVPRAWPRAYPGVYNGYAGGLGPDNLEKELKRISEPDNAGDERIWIDMETRVRSNEDRTFDIAKVRKCLEICKPFVT